MLDNNDDDVLNEKEVAKQYEEDGAKMEQLWEE